MKLATRPDVMNSFSVALRSLIASALGGLAISVAEVCHSPKAVVLLQHDHNPHTRDRRKPLENSCSPNSVLRSRWQEPHRNPQSLGGARDLSPRCAKRGD